MLRLTSLLPKPVGSVGAATGGPPRSVQTVTTSSSWAVHDTSSVPSAAESAPYLIDYLKSGGKAAPTPFNMAYPTEKTLWDWYAKPENAWRMRQFVGAMTDHAKLFKDDIWISGKEIAIYDEGQ